MLINTNLEWARNINTGKQGIVVDRYNRRNDGKAIVQVDTGLGIRHWLASHVEAA